MEDVLQGRRKAGTDRNTEYLRVVDGEDILGARQLIRRVVLDKGLVLEQVGVGVGSLLDS